MKLSLNWLGDHVDLGGLSADEIAHELTMRTALIEQVERRGAGLEAVQVGHVLRHEKHPNADRLSLCVVDAGAGAVEVVCGAPNVAAGQKVAYAPVGATLPNGLTLEARKIRGRMSHGMICALDELGLGDDHEGILVLPADAPVGAPFADYWGVRDVVLEIDNKSITHRADLWGHYGFAREVAAIFGRPLRPLELEPALRPDPACFPVRIDDPAGCPCWLGLRAEVEAGRETPRWMARRLEATGMRPISLLVDLSNYVMLELGQPTHPFDEARLDGGRIVVRRAHAGEQLRTLDGELRALDGEDLVIADGSRPVALAGIMGGQDAEIGAGTRRLLLESASFDATRLRRTSGRLGLRSEAVARFEKLPDAALPELALRRYARLAAKAGAALRIESRFAAAGGVHPRTPTLALRPERLRAKLGVDLGDEEIVQRLRSIELDARPEEGRLVVTVPSFRARRDVTGEDDLIEEVGRLAGYSRIEARLPRLSIAPPSMPPIRRMERRAIAVLAGECGYAETMGYSFATDRDVARYHGADPSRAFVRLRNSRTVDATRMRRSLVPGLLDALRRNLVEHDDVRLFEVGREHLPQAGGAPDALPHERRVLALARASREGDGANLLLELRGDVERLLMRLSIGWEGRRAEAPPAFAHPGRSIEVGAGGSALGVVAQLHPEVARRFELDAAVAVAELDLERMAGVAVGPRNLRPIPTFPPVRRDLAFETPDAIEVAEVERVLREAVGPDLWSIDLFDVYRGAGVQEGCRSLAFRLVIRSPVRTLSDDDVEALQRSAVERLAARGVRLRAGGGGQRRA